MKVSPRTIAFLTDMITGDKKFSDYKTGQQIVHFFNYLGSNDVSLGGTSRNPYTREKLTLLNKQNRIEEAIEIYLAPINFIGKEDLLNDLIDKTNDFLTFDNFKIKRTNNKVKVVATNESTIAAVNIRKIDHDFIRENLEKCDKKITEGDYSGAITNARSMLETMLLHLYKEIEGTDLDAKGDLPKQYKAVAKLLNLSTDDKLKDDFKQILQGLSSVVNGIAAIRNKISDGHGNINKKYKAEKHHAILVVNSAKTLSEFLFSSYEKQYKKKDEK